MMGGLGPLLASLATEDFGALARKTRRNFILYAIAILLALTAYVAGVTAAAIAVAEVAGAATAALVVALSALALALFVLAIVLLLNRQDRIRKRERAARMSGSLLTTAMLTALPVAVRSNPLGVAAVIGGALLLLSLPKGAARKADPGRGAE